MSTVNVNRVVDASGGVLAPISSVMRNRIINGAMRIDQRNAGASVSTNTGNNVYTLDRWNAVYGTQNFYTVQQNSGSVTPPAGFRNYLGVVSSGTNTGDIQSIQQIIEGFNTADLNWGTANAATVTLSFWVRSSLTGTFGGSLQNSAVNRSYPFSYTISAANTWEQKSITIAGDTTGTWLTTNGAGIRLNFSLGTNATFSGAAGAWAASDFRSATGATSVVGTSGATFYITGVQLEVGTQATSFEYRQYQQELALCQRYYYRITGPGAYSQLTSYGNSINTADAYPLAIHPVPLRVVASSLDYANIHITDLLNSFSISAISIYTLGSNTNYTMIATTASGLTALRAYNLRCNNNSSGYLGLSAEL